MATQRQSWKLDVDLPPLTDTKDDISIAPSDVSQKDPLKEIKYGKPISACIGMITEYLLNCSIHGMRYVGERKRHWAERVWWVFSILFSLFLCSKLIMNVYNKWDQSPVIVSFAEKSTPVWEIPFPAVTICPETKANMTFFNYTAMYHTVVNNLTADATDDDLLRMEAMTHICDAHLMEGMNFGYNQSNGRLLLETLEEIAPTARSTMWFCKFGKDYFFGCTNFHKVWTEEGLCFSFNTLRSDELYTDEMTPDFPRIDMNETSKHWSLENGYVNSVSNESFYPHRVMGAGAYAGLYTLLKLYEQDLEYICRGPVQGFKVLLHPPGELPQTSKQYLRIPLHTEVLISIKPNMITTSEGLRHYEPNRRQCYFNSERNLRFFKSYTQRNCELECVANFTYARCGCVKYSMPRDIKTPVCGALSVQCYVDAEYALLKKDFEEGLIEGTAKVKGCNCLPSCTSIVYDAEISQAKFDYVSMFKAYESDLNEFPGMQPARLSIFFKENQFITSKRSELFGQTDFLANCGGLLGLFMGISLLSILEIFYYCTLRLFCNLKARKDRKRKRNKIAAVPEIMVDKPSSDGSKECKLN